MDQRKLKKTLSSNIVKMPSSENYWKNKFRNTKKIKKKIQFLKLKISMTLNKKRKKRRIKKGIPKKNA